MSFFNKKILIAFIMLCMSFSIANAGLLPITFTEEGTDKIDTVFPELIHNTYQCQENCEATFKYCLDGNNEIELSFEESKGTINSISYGYYNNTSYIAQEKDKCTKEIPDISDIGKLENLTVCKEWTYKNVTRYKDVWISGFPSNEKGCYELTIKGTKPKAENVDWIPTIKVKGFLWDTTYTQTKWASWNGTGGTVTYDGLYTVHTFTSSGYFNVTGTMAGEYLIVAGGGGGSMAGGGAGGVLSNSSYVFTEGNYSVVVGTGGLGRDGAGVSGDNGTNSSFNGIVAMGGGGGRESGVVYGSNGGSGGGGSASGTFQTYGGRTVLGQGYDGGGNGNAKASPYVAGGGGGAGSVGGNASTGVCGAGGNGTTNDIYNGTNLYYGGGGGGSAYLGGATNGVGGLGGGGAGDDSTPQHGTNGTGAGGGGTPTGIVGGNGGSGIVIFRYLTPTDTAEITLIDPNGNVTSNNTPAFTYNFTSVFNTTADCILYINGTPYGEEVLAPNGTTNQFVANDTLADDYYVWNVTCDDGQGLANPDSNFDVTIDTSSPAVVIDLPTNTTYTTITSVFNITATDTTGISACLYTLDGQANITLENIDGDFFNNSNTSMTQGLHHVEYFCNDSADNWNVTEDIYFTTDSIAPFITIVHPLNTSYATGGINFNVSLNEEGSMCWVTLDDGAVNNTMSDTGSGLTWGFYNNTLTAGTYSTIYWCNDTVGNVNVSHVGNSFSLIDKIILFLNVTTNETRAGELNKFDSYLRPQQTNISTWIFSTNNSGVWVNDSTTDKFDRARSYEGTWTFGNFEINITRTAGTIQGFNGTFSGIENGTGTPYNTTGYIWDNGTYTGTIWNYGATNLSMWGATHFGNQTIAGKIQLGASQEPMNIKYDIEADVSKTLNDSYSDSIGYMWFANDSDGSWYNSGIQTLDINVPPVMISVDILNATNGTLYEPMTAGYGAVNSSDGDGDNVSYYYRWYIDGLPYAIEQSANITQNLYAIISSKTLQDGLYGHWIFSALSTDGTFNSTWMNSTEITVYNFSYSNITTTTEKSYKTFWINFTRPIIDSANFTFNGTTYEMNEVPLTSYFYYSQEIPNVESTENIYYTYTWYDGNYHSINLTLQINNINILINGTGYPVLHTYFADEQTKGYICNVSTESKITIVFEDGTEEDNYFNTSNTCNVTYSILSDTNDSLQTNLRIYYDKDGYTPRTYIEYNVTFDVTEPLNYTLFLLNESVSTPFVMRITDEAGIPLSDYVLVAKRVYGDGEILTVETGESSAIGEYEFGLDYGEVFYLFNIYNSNMTLIDSLTPMKIPLIYIDGATIFNYVVNLNPITGIATFEDISYSMSMNTNTSKIAVSLSSPVYEPYYITTYQINDLGKIEIDDGELSGFSGSGTYYITVNDTSVPYMVILRSNTTSTQDFLLATEILNDQIDLSSEATDTSILLFFALIGIVFTLTIFIHPVIGILVVTILPPFIGIVLLNINVGLVVLSSSLTFGATISIIIFKTLMRSNK